MFDRRKNDRGFTMAELLIVIAIIGVLSGVSYIAVQSHHRSMAQLERDAVAQELFVAAQNHLAMAKSEDYRGINGALAEGETVSGFGRRDAEVDADNGDIYYFYSAADFTADGSYLLDLMLPFGAIDENVRAGKYIIRYQPRAAVVLDVFYWTTNDSNSRLNCADLGAGSYAELVNNYTGDAHKTYENGVLGWFGGEASVASGRAISVPGIEVENGDRLRVTITNNNDTTDASLKLKLIIKGLSSGAMAALPVEAASSCDRIETDIGGKFIITLDDITADDMHFAQISDDKANFQFLKDGDADTDMDIPFIPGENITVQAVAYSNAALTSIAYSGEQTTNSLFADISQKPLTALYAEAEGASEAEEDEDADEGLEEEEPATAWVTAMIGSIRHLENLDAALSHLDENDDPEENRLNITNAMQTVDLDWGAFLSEIRGVNAEAPVKVYDMDDNAAKANCFVPVTPSHWDDTAAKAVPVALTYDGRGVVATTTVDPDTEETETHYSSINHSVTGLAVDNVYDAADTKHIGISDGGMFGSVSGGAIQNLELIDTRMTLAGGNAGALAGTLSGGSAVNVLARNSYGDRDVDLVADGSVGGLIGAVSGNAKVERCAAALTVVSNEGSAGGLIGAISGVSATVTASYSGGHTQDAGYYELDEDGKPQPIANVTGATYAGGLIGDTGHAFKVENCYSTCSVKGATAGGLSGNANVLVNCYATGLVIGVGDDAVTGALVGELKDTASVSRCLYYEIINEGMPAVGKVPEGVEAPAITALDASAASYDAFVGAPARWEAAASYDEALADYYGGRFNLMAANQLGQAEKAVSEELSDFVATHYGDWPAPEIFVINAKQST